MCVHPGQVNIKKSIETLFILIMAKKPLNVHLQMSKLLLTETGINLSKVMLTPNKRLEYAIYSVFSFT